VGLFRPYQQGQTETEKASDQPTEKAHAKQGEKAAGAPASPKGEAEQIQVTRRRGPQPKSGPTLSRAEAEAARMERLHPNLSRKELRQQDREAKRQARITNLDNLEKRPERQLIRDYVDARRTFSEFIMPIFLVVMVAWFVIIAIFPAAVQVVNAMSVLILVVMALWVLDTIRLWRPVKKQLIARYPDISRRGLLSYLNNRAMTPRRWRKPAPRFKPASRRNTKED
jgi:magnesium-transporting ATPase (P-type)